MNRRTTSLLTSTLIAPSPDSSLQSFLPGYRLHLRGVRVFILKAAPAYNLAFGRIPCIDCSGLLREWIELAELAMHIDAHRTARRNDLSARRLDLLINDLLDVSKLDAGTFKLNKQEFDVEVL